MNGTRNNFNYLNQTVVIQKVVYLKFYFVAYNIFDLSPKFIQGYILQQFFR